MIPKTADIVAGYENNIQILKYIRMVPIPVDKDRFILIVPIDAFETSELRLYRFHVLLHVLHNRVELGVILLSALMVWYCLLVVILISVHASKPHDHLRVARVMPLRLMPARIVVGCEAEGCSKANLVEVDRVINIK